MSEKVYEYKTIKNKGALIHLIKLQGESNWKFHKWDGPAIEPLDEGCEFKTSYYLHGIEYSKERYTQVLRDREGVPYYKQTGNNNRF